MHFSKITALILSEISVNEARSITKHADDAACTKKRIRLVNVHVKHDGEGKCHHLYSRAVVLRR